MLPNKTTLPNGKTLVRRSNSTYDFETQLSHGTIDDRGETVYLEVFSYAGYTISRVFRSLVSCLKYLSSTSDDYRE